VGTLKKRVAAAAVDAYDFALQADTRILSDLKPSQAVKADLRA
jgi:hypothetical protein